MPADSISEHDRLRRTLLRLLEGGAGSGAGMAVAVDVGPTVDVVITPNEINDKHGTGPLVQRVLAGCADLFSIRSRDSYGGEHRLGEAAVVVSQQGATRAQGAQRVLEALGGRRVRRVLCVPFFPDELRTAIALKDLFGARLACWIMDDQNVAVPGIPDPLMREFLEKCDLRLTTHPEMRIAYERKHGLRFGLLPAVAPVEHVLEQVSVPDGEEARGRRGALVGSFWSQRWFDDFCDTVRPTGLEIDWYGNHRSPYFSFPEGRLAEAHVRAHGIVAEDHLAARLRRHPYAVVPTGKLVDDEGNALAVAKLSLPGRILFIASSSHTPVVVMGSRETPASRFVERFGIGVTCDYDPGSFRAAVEQVTAPAEQLRMRQRAAAAADALSSRGIGEWLWRSVEAGAPADDRFERLLPRQESDMVAWIDPPAPPDLYREYVAILQAARRLRSRGVHLDYVLDVGASVGIWSHAVAMVYPEARYVLADPLASRYAPAGRAHYRSTSPRAEGVDVAVSNRRGRATFQVPPDLYGASLLRPNDFRTYQSVDVSVTTVDDLVRDRRLSGRGLLKADVQFAEHLVLEGARRALPDLDVIVLELSLHRYHPESKTFLEMQEVLAGHGFRYFDDAGAWRSPVDGMLLQKDVVFVREHLCVPEGLR